MAVRCVAFERVKALHRDNYRNKATQRNETRNRSGNATLHIWRNT